MREERAWLERPAARGALWVALCFGLTSAVWLAWLDRLALLASGAADWIGVVAGYTVQAAGIGAALPWLRLAPAEDARRSFAVGALLFMAVAAPAALTHAPAVAIAFGLGMNFFCGVIAAFYLYGVAVCVPPEGRGMAFGAGYAIATAFAGLRALAARDGLARGGEYLIYAALCGVVIWFSQKPGALTPGREAGPGDGADGGRIPVVMACAAMAIISAVKGLGFSFPASGLQSGVSTELSRLPYAVGLAAAGLICDRSRRNGMLCAMGALILPFVMVGLTGEPVPAAVCRGLDYLFEGFFTVFRAVLFMDLAGRARRWELAPLGLLFGRLGDAAGAGLSMALSGSRAALVLAAALAFFAAMAVCYRLYRALYEPETARRRSEQEVFDAFCLHHDLSDREREILRLMLDRRTNAEIAEALFISENTVKYHVRNVLQKTGCANRVEVQRQYSLAMYADLDGAPESAVS